MYGTFRGKETPKPNKKKTNPVWPVVLSQFYFTSLYGTYLHPAIYEMDLVPLNF